MRIVYSVILHSNSTPALCSRHRDTQALPLASTFCRPNCSLRAAATELGINEGTTEQAKPPWKVIWMVLNWTAEAK